MDSETTPAVPPQVALLRLPQVLALFPVGKSTFWSGIKKGEYPAGIRHGRVTFWRSDEIHQLIEKISREGSAR